MQTRTRQETGSGLREDRARVHAELNSKALRATYLFYVELFARHIGRARVLQAALSRLEGRGGHCAEVESTFGVDYVA
jgi:hypothetical protein